MDTIGFLVVVTVLLIAVETARKITWAVVGIGWLLVVVRLAMVVVDSY